MNYLRPFKTCFCGKHVLDLSRHRPRLRFERRSKFSSRSTAPLPGRMRNSPSPKGERRPSHVIGNAVHVMRIATGEIEDTKATPRTEAPKGRLEGRQSPPRHDPIRVFAKEVHRQNAAKAGRTITDHLMVRAQIPTEHSRSIVRGRESAPDSGARPQISRSKPQAANLVGSTSSILSELTIGIARGFMASGTSRTRSM
jgi:hypothetical protein